MNFYSSRVGFFTNSPLFSFIGSKSGQTEIYFGVDNLYVWPLLVSLFSAKKNHKSLKTVNIAYDPQELTEQNRELLVNSSKILGLKIRFLAIHLASTADFGNHLSKSAMLRLSIPLTTKNSILWLDSDLLLLHGWDEISTKVLDVLKANYLIGARKHWPFEKSKENLAIQKSGEVYFNTGVLILNSKKWKKLRMNLKVNTLIPLYNQLNFEWADQDILNYLIGEEYCEVSKEYNCHPTEYSAENTRILHFAGSNKPWTFEINRHGRLTRKKEVASLEFSSQLEHDSFVLYRTYEAEALEIYNLD